MFDSEYDTAYAPMEAASGQTGKACVYRLSTLRGIWGAYVVFDGAEQPLDLDSVWDTELRAKEYIELWYPMCANYISYADLASEFEL